MKTPGANGIALISLIAAVILMAFLFVGSRNDPSLRIAALVAGTGLVSSLAAIASTILTGKDVTKPSDLPPNSVSTSTVNVRTNPSLLELGSPAEVHETPIPPVEPTAIDTSMRVPINLPPGH